MGYIAFYRKFRPQIYDEAKGQDHIVKALRNQVKHDVVSHAYLFHGTRGTGKTTMARIFSKAINCENPVEGNPCGGCEFCRSITDGSSANVIEIDAASNNKVSDIKRILEDVSYPPINGKWKIYIIDEVHSLKGQRGEAFDMLLKTLEEPPAHAVFIMATTDPQKVPATILSRCQRYEFRRISVDLIKMTLQSVAASEGIDAENRALEYIARVADGSMRDALSILEHFVTIGEDRQLTYNFVVKALAKSDMEKMHKLFQALYHKDLRTSILILSEANSNGINLFEFVNDFVWFLRSIMIAQVTENLEDFFDAPEETIRSVKELAKSVDQYTVDGLVRHFSDLSSNIARSDQKRVMIEALFVRICRKDDRQSVENRIRLLEEHEKDIRNQISI
ncbi:DNA polymerase III subunit gamma/tau, partial [Butyrivibrio sp. XBB1001]|uniref:DNA polymerase III subunit gamma/tau n=1 Tax=Butyrivibrio sp. XBB1001 TaxID=1280682 RepID=UPI0004142F81